MLIKVTSTTDGKNKREKNPRVCRANENIRKINVFLNQCSDSFPSLWITVHLTSVGYPPILWWFLGLFGGGRATQFLIWSYCAFLWILVWICTVTEFNDPLKSGQYIWSSRCEKPGHQARDNHQWSLEGETWKNKLCSYPSLLSTQTVQATSSRLPGCRGGITEQRLLELAGSGPERRGPQREERTLCMGRESAGAIAESLHSGEIIYRTQRDLVSNSHQSNLKARLNRVKVFLSK